MNHIEERAKHHKSIRDRLGDKCISNSRQPEYTQCETEFQYPVWWNGPRELGFFGCWLFEAKRYNEGKPSLFYTFPRGDPMPDKTLHDINNILATIPLDTSLGTDAKKSQKS